MTNIGMVIINYNDFETTNKLVNNIKDYKCLKKIVIVDNASTDNSYKLLKKIETKKICIIKAKENKGYAAGLNIGAKEIIKDGHYHIIFSNSDIIINKEKDLMDLSNNMKKDIAVVAPVVVEHNQLNRGWKIPTIKQEIKFNLPLISRKYKKELLYSEDHYKNDTSIVDVVSGCFFMVDSKVLEEVDFFDEQTFLYYEENILSCKLKKINKKELIDNRIVVLHEHSVSIDKSFKRINKYNILKDSQKYFVEKYLKASKKDLVKLNRTRKLSFNILKIRCFLHK